MSRDNTVKRGAVRALFNVRQDQHDARGVMMDVLERFDDAVQRFHPYNSAHEGIAVIREEYLELEHEVFKRERSRDPHVLRAEAIDIAVTAIRFVVDMDLADTSLIHASQDIDHDFHDAVHDLGVDA